jgi:S1-C subfamily serine protease
MRTRNRRNAATGFVKFGTQLPNRRTRAGESNWKERFLRPVVHPATVPAYPICVWEASESKLQFESTSLGTAFFINEGGLFLTAAHVVQDLGKDAPLRILYPDLDARILIGLKPCQLAIHPTLDIAVGRVQVPSKVRLHINDLADGEMHTREPVQAFGYAHSLFIDHPAKSRLIGGSGLLGLAASVTHASHCGEVIEYCPQGVGFLKGQPLFQHTAETIGGQSGGPVFSAVDGFVYGITSRGCEEYGTAIDIRSILDWPIPFLKNWNIRGLGDFGFVLLHKRQSAPQD